VLGYIANGREEGARLAMGGKQVMSESGGFYIEPTVFDDVAPGMKISREEIFGPVLSAIAFDTEEEAVRIANDSIYGLAAALWTRELGRAHRVARKLRAGSVWVNYWDGGDMTAPFGGYKQAATAATSRCRPSASTPRPRRPGSTWLRLRPRARVSLMKPSRAVRPLLRVGDRCLARPMSAM
jgi:gamma-glutamyl-gamma-aminobutyraldehyde dehydrogenase